MRADNSTGAQAPNSSRQKWILSGIRVFVAAVIFSAAVLLYELHPLAGFWMLLTAWETDKVFR